MNSPRIHLAYIVAFFVAAYTQAVADDSPVLVIEDPTLQRRERNSLSCSPARKIVTIRNRATETLYLQTVEFEWQEGGVRVDRRPQLIFQLLPFLDLLCVKSTNIGWGPFTGGTLRLFDDAALTHDGSRSLTNVLDVESLSVELGEIEDESLCVFRTGTHAVPYAPVFGAPVDEDIMSRPHAGYGRIVLRDFTYTVQKLVMEQHDVPEAVYTGAVSFNGVLSPDNVPSTDIEYFGRKLSTTQLAQDETLLLSNNLLMKEGMFSALSFTFGGTTVRTVAERKTASMIVMTADLGDGHARSIRCPATATLHPGEELTCEFEFWTDFSADFEISGHWEYKLGQGGVSRQAFESSIRGKTYIPRQPRLGYADTIAFLSSVKRADPAIEDRASTLIQGSFNSDGSPIRDAVVQLGQDQSWKIRDALLLLMASDNPATRSHAFGVLRRFSDWLVKRNNDSNFVSMLASQLFPMLCRHEPTNAVRFAIRQRLTEKDWTLIPLCIGFKETRPLLRREATDLGKSITTAMARGHLSEEDIVIGSMIGMDGIEDAIIERLDGKSISVYDLPLLMLAANELHNHRTDAAIVEVLGSSDTSPDMAAHIVETLCGFANDRCRTGVIRRAAFAATVEPEADFLVACLTYFRQFPGSDTLPALRSLRTYAYSSRVRDEAKALLGEQ